MSAPPLLPPLGVLQNLCDLTPGLVPPAGDLPPQPRRQRDPSASTLTTAPPEPVTLAGRWCTDRQGQYTVERKGMGAGCLWFCLKRAHGWPRLGLRRVSPASPAISATLHPLPATPTHLVLNSPPPRTLPHRATDRPTTTWPRPGTSLPPPFGVLQNIGDRAPSHVPPKVGRRVATGRCWGNGHPCAGELPPAARSGGSPWSVGQGSPPPVRSQSRIAGGRPWPGPCRRRPSFLPWWRHIVQPAGWVGGPDRMDQGGHGPAHRHSGSTSTSGTTARVGVDFHQRIVPPGSEPNPA